MEYMKKILFSFILSTGIISTSSQAVDLQDLKNLTAKHPRTISLTAFCGLSYALYELHFGTPDKVQKTQYCYDTRNDWRDPDYGNKIARLKSVAVSAIPSLALFYYLSKK
jgi:hypothetical protein